MVEPRLHNVRLGATQVCADPRDNTNIWCASPPAEGLDLDPVFMQHCRDRPRGREGNHILLESVAILVVQETGEHELGSADFETGDDMGDSDHFASESITV